MSVSVNFFLEVRHDGKWALLRWKQPTELETYFHDREKHKWETRAEIFSCDYCSVDEFIEDYSQRMDEFPDDATPELQRVLKRNKNAYWMGCFDVGRIWVYLNDKREEMLESLIQSRDYQLVHKLNKIEKKLFGAKEATPMNLSNEYYKSTGIRDLYESYESRVGTVECLGSAISRFTDAFWAHVNNEDMRVVFQVW